MNRVRIHIDQLSLQGVEPSQQREVLSAFQQELSQLLSAGGLPSESRHLSGLRLTLPAGQSGAALGQSAARSLVGGFKA